MKKHGTTVLLVLLLAAGLSLLLYPSVSDYWNSLHASRAVTGYAQDVQSLTDDAYDAMLQAARDYNQSLAVRETSYFLSERQQAEYDSLLDVGGTGIMGRKTLDSFPGGRPLPKRRNIVITRSPDFHREGCETVSTPEDALALVEDIRRKEAATA